MKAKEKEGKGREEKRKEKKRKRKEELKQQEDPVSSLRLMSSEVWDVKRLPCQKRNTAEMIQSE